MRLKKINSADGALAYQLFESCCCAPHWINAMLEARPFADKAALFNASENAFAELTDTDYLCAFTGHPQIGNLATLHEKYANTSGAASHEQAAMSTADKHVLEEMLQLNKAYLEKFGFIFIVCASGKSAPEMLALIKARLPNDRQHELTLAGHEQAKITTLRLEKL